MLREKWIGARVQVSDAVLRVLESDEAMKRIAREVWDEVLRRDAEQLDREMVEGHTHVA